MFKAFEIVVVTRDVPDQGVRGGAVGTIVEIYAGGRAYEVEFVEIEGKAIPLATLTAGDIRAATSSEIRALNQAAESVK